MLLLLGVLLVVGAFVAGRLALSGMPTRPVPRSRIEDLVVEPRKSALTRIADRVVGGVDAVVSRPGGWRPFSARELELAGVAMPMASLLVLIGSIAVVMFSVGTLFACWAQPGST